MRATLPGTIADVDSEFLHDFRVAVRRTRSLQRQLEPVFPPEPLAHFRSEFRWLQQATGPVRDLDVHQLDLVRVSRGRATHGRPPTWRPWRTCSRSAAERSSAGW